MNTILITGTSSGIGRAAVLRFQAEGWNVAATMRNPDQETELQTLSNVAVIQLDVTHPESIKAAVAATLDRFGRLDVLLNNAGYGLAGPLEAVDPSRLERQFATNVYGPVYTIQACLPHFRAQGSGLIINVSSIGGRLVLPFNSLYHGTKFAIEGISESMALELAPHNIKVKLIEPGGVRTDFAGRSLDLMTKDGLNAYDASLQSAMGVFSSFERDSDYSDASDIADVIYTAATDGTNQLRYLAGKDAVQMAADRAQRSDEEYAAWVIDHFKLQA
jgi:NAD(P)-dependent dehydrogenase (short-subunit alcohol dehydrogenase family)